MSLYQIRVEDINNNVHVLEEYKGKCSLRHPAVAILF